MLTNGSGGDLAEVDIILTLTQLDGKKREGKQYWTTWSSGEVRKVNMAAEKYQKLRVSGSAKSGGKMVSIESEWSWNWK